MTVSIDIDLDAMDAFQEIGQLRLALESLEDDLDIDLDIEGDLGEKLDALSDKMGDLSDSFTKDINETLDRLENLEFDDVTVVQGNGDSGGDTGSDSGDGRSWQRVLGTVKHSNFKTGLDDFDLDDLSTRDHDYDRLNIPSMGGDGPQSLFGALGRTVTDEDLELPDSSTDDDSSGGRQSGSLFDNLFGDDGKAGGLRQRFKKLIPSMSTWINMVGMAIPALAAMAVQAAGVAAAMGSVAVAGGAIIGLGLIGHGDSMAESFRRAKQQVADLKKGLFEAFEPTADLFSGAQAEFFDFIPGQVERIARSMEGLIVFKDDLFSLFRGGTEFMASFLNIITDNEKRISDMTATFSSLVGSSILDFFSWLFEVGSKNQGMLIKLGTILKDVSIALYNVFMMVSRAIIMLKPFFTLLGWVSNLLNNALVSGFVAIIAVVYILTSALGFMFGSLSGIAALLGTGLIPLFSSLFTYMSTWLFQTLAQTMANYGLAASIANIAAALGTLMAMSGVGLLVAGAGLAIGNAVGIGDVPTGVGRRGRGSGGQTVINEGDTVNVDLSNADTTTIEKFSDMGGGGGPRGPTGGTYTSN